MNREDMLDLYCEWCVLDCQKIRNLTDEERHGCLASTGFVDELVLSIYLGVALLQ